MMPAFKRHLVVLVLVMTPLVCAAVIGWKFSEQAAQQNRNHALIDAINADRPDEARLLLAAGADANARELPPDTRTLWQKVREIFQPVKRDEAEYSSALKLALWRDFAGDNPNTLEMRFQLLKALHDAGAKEDGRFAPSQASLEKAEQQIKEYPTTPVGSTSLTSTIYEADSTLVSYLIEQGLSARAMADWAQCRFREDQYADAVHAYHIAALWQPADAGLQSRLAQAEEYKRVAATIQQTLPAQRKVHSVRPYPSAALPNAWAALYGAGNDSAINDAQVGLYQASGADFRQICHTPVRDHLHWAYGDFSEPSLRVFPLTGRAAPEIILSGSVLNSVWGPHYLEVFTYAGGRFTNIASMTRDNTVEIEKAPRGNGYVIRSERFTGVTPRNEGIPMRSDYYAFNGRRFAFADAQFPDAYRAYISEAEALLRRYPADYDLLQNLAAIYKVTGRPQKSAEYYRKAERLCRQAIAKESEADAGYDRKILSQIVARDLERPF